MPNNPTNTRAGALCPKAEHHEEYRNLGMNILYYRRHNRISQQQLAQQVKISRTHLSNIENNTNGGSISFDLLFRIAKALGVTPAMLLEAR